MRFIGILLAATLRSTLANPECFHPVHLAAQNGDAVELADILEADKYQADAEDKCDTRVRPLMLAANSGSVAAVRVLLEAGASPSVAHGSNGVTPLIAAAVAGNTEMVDLLLARKAKIDMADVRNWTAICFASQYGHVAVVKQLIAAGADTGWTTAAGLTPWALALDASRDMPAEMPQEKAGDYAAILDALVAAGAPHGDEAALHLVGTLPLKAIAKEGVPDGAALQAKLLGQLHFLRVVAGIDPQQAAAHEALQAAHAGGSGLDADGSIGVQSHAVGGGPMPVYAGQREGEAETLILKFDAQPGSMVWQLIGAVADGASEGGKGRGNLYLRGQLPNKEKVANYLDPVNALRWEVAVVPHGRDSGAQTKWLKTKLRFVRGAEGASLAARASPPPPQAPAGPADEPDVGVYQPEDKEEL